MSTPYQRRQAEAAALAASRTPPACSCGRPEPENNGRLGHGWTCIYWRWLMQAFC